uniref:Cytochrome c oxidase subunit 3 n=1 Tax=Mastigoproctus giganteus TaxID=58767 RepID=Q535E8_MASGI|nr:cytochrome c oxidase subunit III [Mastigoproctus giganteus]
MTKISHPFHMVEMSPWPLTSAMGALCLTSGCAYWFHSNSMQLFFFGVSLIIMSSLFWWRDVSREASFQGLHTTVVLKGLQVGMILFIISEVFFFISFFWSFFHASLTPNVELGSTWPPNGIIPFNPMHIPLLNTAVLLASGVSVTWTHHSILHNNWSSAKNALLITIMLGVYFTILQSWEYSQASFSIADSSYGSVFFMATGFHGLHVIIGSTFLLVCFFRLLAFHFSPWHHFGFEAAAWYWHFVDVVWLFLFSVVYWWGY